MKHFLKKTVWLFVVAASIVTLDQVLKKIVITHLPYGEVWSPWEWLTPYARIVHWSNTGVAFGMLQGMNPVFIGLAVLVSFGIVYYYPKIEKKDWMIKLALMMELGGAVGNLVDRIKYGHVIDFISVGTFPVWNIADACITVGVIILLLGVWLQEKREKNGKAKTTQEQADNEVSP
ncbi:MAG TPA: signal peptidase II [Anaerolineaceae bacterium]|nr:signal peptidase II [Anaerolineaceae bacterium]HOQ69089.1 signal peptidase II [Anaerolineaceae bacterium]HOS53695.1 signal peptidase II [Anaerolineaceae bacterium]HPD62966.1 signal peptidase II [Anaerolineaceae bacterium]HQK05024.1 signal peptidase II [Anaerolineaceae bacterium]